MCILGTKLSATLWHCVELDYVFSIIIAVRIYTMKNYKLIIIIDYM
jgi:hypothetical protein